MSARNKSEILAKNGQLHVWQPPVCIQGPHIISIGVYIIKYIYIFMQCVVTVKNNICWELIGLVLVYLQFTWITCKGMVLNCDLLYLSNFYICHFQTVWSMSLHISGGIHFLWMFCSPELEDTQLLGFIIIKKICIQLGKSSMCLRGPWYHRWTAVLIMAGVNILWFCKGTMTT